MFKETWQWAGKYRISNKNIGVDYRIIPMEFRKLLDDVKYWIENHSLTERQIAVRLHHRLVKIHLYANGNGRHARLVADIFLKKQGIQSISWRQNQRSEYIAALKIADDNEY